MLKDIVHSSKRQHNSCPILRLRGINPKIRDWYLFQLQQVNALFEFLQWGASNPMELRYFKAPASIKEFHVIYPKLGLSCIISFQLPFDIRHEVIYLIRRFSNRFGSNGQFYWFPYLICIALKLCMCLCQYA